nr:FG-GAP-like repeat-containing protein [Streptomyces dengpaensis]
MGSGSGGPETPLTAGDSSVFGESPPGGTTDDGRFVQQVPVSVPSFHGLEPSPGLTYDSRHGAGIAGLGWDLSGDSSIQRVARGRGAPRMDGSDDFLLDGERLVACQAQAKPGVSCRSGGTHSTERETYRRIARTGDGWLVWDRGGTLSTYTSWLGKAHNVMFGLAERRNSHGDEVRYHRWCDGSDACYLKDIEYLDTPEASGRTRIVLHYEDRPDPVSQGMGEALLVTGLRLTTIEVRVGPAVRSVLALRYAKGAASQLAGVTRYGNDAALDGKGRVLSGTALPEETFGWQQPDLDSQGPAREPLAGDSFQDTDQGGPGYRDTSMPTALPLFSNPPGDMVQVGGTQFLLADVNGDGRSDHISVLGGAYRAKAKLPMALQIRLRTATGDYDTVEQPTTWPLTFEEVGTTGAAQANRLLTGDVNGDGRADLVNVWGDPVGNVPRSEIALGGPNGSIVQQGDTAMTALSGWNPRWRWFLADHDGDGRDDLITVHGVEGANNSIVTELLVALSDGSRFGEPTASPTPWSYERRDDAHWFVGDADGDRRADVLGVESRQRDSGPTASLRLALSRGDGSHTTLTQSTQVPFDSPEFALGTIPAITTYATGELAHAGDFDGDGRTDLLLAQRYQNDSGWRVRLTTALARYDGSFETESRDTDVDASWMTLHQRLSLKMATLVGPRWLITDLDGDGRSDVLLVGPAVAPSEPAQYPATVKSKRIFRDDPRPGSPSESWRAEPDESLPWDFHCHTLSPLTQLACGNGPTAHEVGTGDVNGDGRGDLVFTGPASSTLSHSSTFSINVHFSASSYSFQAGKSADVSGDGREDWVYVRATNPGLTVYTALASSGHQLTVARRKLEAAKSYPGVDLRRLMVADFGSPAGGPDGKADLLLLTADSAASRVHSLLLFSVGLGNYAVAPGSAGTGLTDPDVRSWVAADVNGDGTADLVRVRPSGSAEVSVTTLFADGQGGWRPVTEPVEVDDPPSVTSRMMPADIDGDGRVDLVQVSVMTPRGGDRQESVLALLSNGAGDWAARSTTLGAPTAAATNWQPAELNGDGRIDLIRIAFDKASPTEPGTTRADRLLSYGLGSFDHDSAPLGIGDHSPRWNAADLDGDGCDEVTWVNSGTAADPGFGFVRRIANSCAKLAPERTALTSPAPAAAGWVPVDRAEDTTRQLFRVVPGSGPGAGPDQAHLPLGAAPRLMNMAYSGLGRTIRVTYESSAGRHDGVPPGVAVPVVRTQELDGGNRLLGWQRTSYVRQGLAYSYPLQRLLGFRKAEETVEGRRKTVTLYPQTPGCAGRANAQTTLSPNGTLLLDERAMLAESSDGPPWTCEPFQTIRRECKGESDCRQIRVRYEHDDYGNTTVVEESGVYDDANRDGQDDTPADNRITKTGYVPNVDAYIVALPAWTRIEDGSGTPASERQTVYDHNTSYLQAPAVGDARTVSVLEPTLGRFLATGYQHDGHGNVTAVTDPSGVATRTDWDETYARFPVRECNSVWCTSTAWDTVLGRATTMIDANGLTTSIAWDPLGRHRRTDNPDGGCLIHRYVDWGVWPGVPGGQRISEDTCSAGGVNGLVNRMYHFDGLHRVHRDERSGGYTRFRTFTDDSTLVAQESDWGVRGAAVPVTRFGYDTLDRPLLVLRPDRSTVAYSYSPGMTRRSDETNRAVQQFFDGLGRVTRAEEAGTGAPPLTTQLRYDALDQLSESVAPTGTTTWKTGPLGWVWRECDPDSGCVSRTFDDAGRVRSRTNAAGQRVEHNYDALGRLTSRSFYDGSLLTDRATWAYDKDPDTGLPHGHSTGQVTRTHRTSSQAREDRWYDAGGRLALERTCVAATCAEVGRTWGPGGELVAVRYPDRTGKLSDQAERVGYSYDEAGRIRSVGGYATEVTYTPGDRVASITHGNGVTEQVTPDPDRAWPDRIQLSGMTGNWPTLSLEFGHDTAGRITGEDRSAPVGYQKRYGYDAYGRLGNESSHLKDTYSYDGPGRLTGRSAVGAYSYSDPAHPNAVTSAGQATYTYDAAGRALTGTRTIGHTWDADGNLTGFTTKDGKSVTYGYDADGQRVVKDVPSLLSRTVFADPYVEIDDWGEPRKSYLLGSRTLARSHWTWGTGGPADPPGVRYYHVDARGSVAVISRDDGRPLQYYDYEPFGTARYTQPGTGDDLRFIGARQDDDSGLVHLGARELDPILGRFITPDNIVADPQRGAAYDRYAYGYYDPINTKDPSGHEPEPLTLQEFAFDPLAAAPANVSSAPRSARLLDRGLRSPLSDVELSDSHTDLVSGLATPTVAQRDTTAPAVQPYTFGIGFSADAQIGAGLEAGIYYVWDTQGNVGIMFSGAARFGPDLGWSAGVSGFVYFNATVQQVAGYGVASGIDTPFASGAWVMSCQVEGCLDVRHGVAGSVGVGFQLGLYFAPGYSYILMLTTAR